MPTVLSPKTSEKHETKRLQERLMREQQIIVKYGNSPLGKGVIARLRRKTYVASKLGTPSNLSRVQHLRVSKNLKQVKRILGNLVAVGEAERWLSAPNAQLGGTRPIDSIKQGKASQVIEMLARLEEGVHV